MSGAAATIPTVSAGRMSRRKCSTGEMPERDVAVGGEPAEPHAEKTMISTMPMTKGAPPPPWS